MDLELLPAYMSAPAATEPDAIEIHPSPQRILPDQLHQGQTAPEFEKAAYTIETETYCSRQPHLTIEPDCGLAYMDESGCLTIHSKSIGIHLHHAMVCPGIGIEPEKLRIVQNPAGGTVRL